MSVLRDRENCVGRQPGGSARGTRQPLFSTPRFSNTIFRSLGSRIGWGAKKELAMAAPFKIVGIDHVVLRAADPAALERFYLDVLGLIFELRQGKLAQVRAGQVLVDIVPADETGPARG